MERAISPGGDGVGALQEGVLADRRQGGREVAEARISRRMLRQEPDKTVRLLCMLPDMMHAVGARDGDIEPQGDQHTPGGERTPSPLTRVPSRWLVFPER